MPSKLRTALKYIGAFIVALIVPGGFIVAGIALAVKFYKSRKVK